ncbi:cysteine desulfurase family protein [Lactococcus petauri]|uniref:cysteine desulfurase family protein n=1 Tax=Lactococcus petauri TaxID=1940789 RepID=UPI001BCDF817|nr:cysteine desulfurase family protein [Lactococcus petauri]MBS4459349.1 cysteine desulfurase [Lactococcus petauri]
MIYLDNAATTPILPEVVDVMTEVLANNFGNPSSTHTFGRQASQLVRQARETVAKALQVSPGTITFTSGGSESNSTALVGYALANRQNGNHIITTALEHPSVLNALDYLKTRHGFDVTFVQPQTDGSFPAQLIENELRDETILVSMMMANNETGQLLPIKEVGQLLENHQAVFHVDSVQTMGKIPVHPEELKIDFLSASAHKFHGPKGVGFLYHRSGLKFDSIIHGGEQEEKRRAGTENLHSLLGMAKALQIATNNMNANYAHVEKLKVSLLDDLADIEYYTHEFGPSMPHVVNIGFPGKNHDLLLAKLDLAGVAISTGSACTAGTVDPSHVLEAVYGSESPKLKENIRVSFSELNTEEEIYNFVQTLKERAL